MTPVNGHAPKKVLRSTDDVIDALGGNKGVAQILGVHPAAVSAYRTWYRAKFPPKHYEVMKRELTRRELAAPASLWGMTEAIPHD
jgi:DNA-binding transcriptional regulator YdaS (Cro superfamily)